MVKRNISEEMISAVEDFQQSRQGKLTLRTHKVEHKELPPIEAEEIVHLREKLCMSRGVFAAKLRIPPRSLERWEQGRSKANLQAIVLFKLVEKYPEVLDKISAL